MTWRIFSFVLLALSACASSPVSKIRFANRPVAWEVNDRSDVPVAPRNRPFLMNAYRVESVEGHIEGTLALHGKPRAQDINALGEVPNSTWFTNRVGVREVSLAEVRRGPEANEPADAYLPWTITATKVGGLAPGLLFKDARGEKYILKFDRPQQPGLDTGADIVCQRLLHLLGYNVPSNDVVTFRREDLRLAEDAEVKDLFGNTRAMTAEDLDATLARGNPPDAEGKFRGLASKYLSGKPIGGYARAGIRDDDPNDAIDHEHRRSIRGQKIIFAWLGHTDIKQDNTLDMWIEDRDTHYVKHYLLDFGNALGVWAMSNPIPWSGFKHSVDFSYGAASVFTLGLWVRPWERIPDAASGIEGVGWFESELYDPANFKSNQYYPPFTFTDRFDGFWAAKIIMRITPEQIDAAVRAAAYNKEAHAYLTRTLIERQHKTGKYWLSQVAPLDEFVVRQNGDSHELCFDDLMVRYGFEPESAVTYWAIAYDRAGRETGWKAQRGKHAGHQICYLGLTPSRSKDGYMVVRIAPQSDTETLPGVEVHLAARRETGALQIVGLVRE